MRLFAILAVLFVFTIMPAYAEDEVRLDHKGIGAMDAPMVDQEDISTDAVSDMGSDSGSSDLAIKIERGGYAVDDAENDIGGNGPLSRDGGFNFGPAN